MPSRRWSCAVVVSVSALLAGCSSGSTAEEAEPTGADASSPDDAGLSVDGAASDGGDVLTACGRLTTPCDEGGACEGAADCADGICREGVCRKPSPSNGVQDGDETDLDCGGRSAPACDDGKKCVLPDDCTNGVCTGGVCQAAKPDDGVKNGDETGTDCGGTKAPKCAIGEGCLADTDCNNVRCDVTGAKVCKAPAHDDGLKNGTETDTDCGGADAPKCATGQACVGDGDCDKVRCDVGGTKLCRAPAKNDGLMNGSETDIDCGGAAPTNAPACGLDKACKVHGDSASDGCGYDGKCVLGRSCTGHFGGDTCGSGEVGDPAAKHESCCATIKVPGRAIRYGKYEITAGRMRAFIERTGGNVRTFIDANPTSQIRNEDKQYLPEGWEAPTRVFRHCDWKGQNCGDENMVFGANEYLGNYVFLPDRPCANCGQGCSVGTKAQGGYGHPTYWMPKDLQSKFGAIEREISQEVLDAKSLNCTPQLLFAAFCKWDGGRLPTQEELGGNISTSAWGSSSYPWGSSPSAYDTTTPAAAGRVQWTDSQIGSAFFVPAISRTGGGLDPNNVLLNMANANPFRSDGKMQVIGNLRYVYPMPDDWGTTDQAYAIAAPGRFVRDRRSLGVGAHDGIFDVTANLMETTGDQQSNDDANHGSMPRVRWVGGSFEGHQVQRGGYTGNGNVLTKYGKVGARCVYDD